MKVLFLVIDQFRADLLDGALAAHVNLPNLRALAADAVSFANHVTVVNPCGPSRASLLTGQYAMNHRSVRNGAPLRHDIPNLATEVRKAGIAPLLFGYTDTTLDPRGRAPGDPALRSYEQPMPGFDEVVEMRLEESWPWRAHLAAKGYDCPPYSEFYTPVAGPEGRRLDDPAFYRAEDSDTAFLTDRFLSHMAARQGQGDLAHLTYIRPHPPFVAPAPYNRMYTPDSLPPPASLDPSLANHPFLAAPLTAHWAASSVDGFGDLDWSEGGVQTIRALYLGLATEVDHHIGRIIDWLKTTGAYDETLIVVTADHGEMLGDFGHWGKTSFFDAAYRVPLIIRDPRQPAQHGHVVQAMTESVDVMPTILDWLECPVPASVNGRPLNDFLEGRDPSDWRKSSYSEMAFGNPIAPTRWQKAHGLTHHEATLAILRRDAHTLVHFARGYDPILLDGQGRNSADNPSQAALLLSMTQELLSHIMQHPDRTLSDLQITSEGVRGKL